MFWKNHFYSGFSFINKTNDQRVDNLQVASPYRYFLGHPVNNFNPFRSRGTN